MVRLNIVGKAQYVCKCGKMWDMGVWDQDHLPLLPKNVYCLDCMWKCNKSDKFIARNQHKHKINNWSR